MLGEGTLEEDRELFRAATPTTSTVTEETSPKVRKRSNYADSENRSVNPSSGREMGKDYRTLETSPTISVAPAYSSTSTGLLPVWGNLTATVRSSGQVVVGQNNSVTVNHYNSRPDLAGSSGVAPSRPYVSLPQVLPNFVGREEEARTVLEKLQSSKLVCIVGPAGVGKTQLAKKVFLQYIESNGMKGAYLEVTLGKRVPLLSSTTCSAADLYRYIKTFLIQEPNFALESENEDLLLRQINVLIQPDSLLLIDACESCVNEELNRALHKWIGRLLSSPFNIRVIATSQRKLVGLLPLNPNFHLDPLTEEDALTMIGNAVEQSQCNTNLLRRLIHRCSRFPLALAIVCSLLQGGDDPQELCERLEASPESRIRTLSPRFEDADIGSLQRMEVALSGFFKRLESRNITAYNALLVLSVIPQAFDKETMIALIRNSLKLSHSAVQIAIKLLKEHCFLHPSLSQDGREVYLMHSLIRDFAEKGRKYESALDCKSKTAFIKHFCSLLEKIGTNYHGDGPSRTQSFKAFDFNIESFTLLDRALIDKEWETVIEQPELISCIESLTRHRAGMLFVFMLPLQHHIEALKALLVLVRKKSLGKVAEALVLLDLGKTMKSTWKTECIKTAQQHFEDAKRLLENQVPKSGTVRFYEADCLKSCGKVRHRLAVQTKVYDPDQLRDALQQIQHGTAIFRDLLKDLESHQCDTTRNDIPNVRDVKRNLASCFKGQGNIRYWLEGSSQEAYSLLEKALVYRVDADGEYEITVAKLLLDIGKLLRFQSKTSYPNDRQKLLFMSLTVLTNASTITSVCGHYGPVAGKIYFHLGLAYKDWYKAHIGHQCPEILNEALEREILCLQWSITIQQQYSMPIELGKSFGILGTARSMRDNFVGAEEAFKISEACLVGDGASGDDNLDAVLTLYWSWSQTYRRQQKYDQEKQCLEKWIEQRLSSRTDNLRLQTLEKRTRERLLQL
jgi:tetratricopeptide (TPR) repeat protein